MKKKIFLLYEFLSEPGGLERLMINHANFLKKKGYEVKILTCHIDKNIFNLLPFNNVQVEDISKIKTPFEALNLILCFLGLNNIKKYNPDAFLSYSAPMNFIIKKNSSIKINYINHFAHFLYLNGREKIEWASSTQGLKRWISVVFSWFFGKSLKKLDKTLVRKNSLIFSNSNFTKKRIDELYEINSIVNYPPVSYDFKPSKNKVSDKFLFSSGRIIPDKKYEWLVESLAYLKNKLPLYISGSIEKSYKDKLQNLADELKVEIKFLGRLSTKDLIKYYSSAQVYVFPSPLEDFGLVPAESLSCGTPVIAWNDRAGPAEQIANNVNGFLANPYDLKDFARKIDLCLDLDIKNKNKKRILESAKKFSTKEVSRDFIRQINKVML